MRIKTYIGFDYINELDRFESTSKYAINIIKFNEDNSAKYIRKSNMNEQKIPKYLNYMKIISQSLQIYLN